MPQVVQLIESTVFSNTPDSTKGTRTYVDAAALPLQTSTELPTLTSCWNDSWTRVLVSDINISYLGDNASCPKKYVVNYSSGVDGMEQMTGTVEPLSINIGSEYYTYRETTETLNDSYSFKYPDGVKATDITVNKRVLIENFSLHRKIYSNDLPDFIQLCMERVGTINDAAFMGVPRGLLLFAGANLEEVRGSDGRINWKAILQFKLKAVQWADDQGWNMFFNPKTKTWDKPTLNGQSMYKFTTFDDLVDFGDSPPITYPPLPIQ